MKDIEVKPVYICTHCIEPTYSKNKCDNCGKELFINLIADDNKTNEPESEDKDWSKLYS